MEAEEETDDLDVDIVIEEDVDLFDVEDVDFAVILDFVDELVFKVELVPVDLLALDDVLLVDVDETKGFVTRQEQAEDTFAGAFEHCEI